MRVVCSISIPHRRTWHESADLHLNREANTPGWFGHETPPPFLLQSESEDAPGHSKTASNIGAELFD